MEDKSGRESKKRLWDTGRYLVGCLLLLCMAGKSYAQGDDFGVWTSAEVKKKIFSGFDASLEGEFRTRDGLQTVERWSGSAGVSYKMFRWLKASAGYTFIHYYHPMEVTKKGNYIPEYWQPKHRVNLSLTGKVDWRRFTFSLRERWQYTQLYPSERCASTGKGMPHTISTNYRIHIIHWLLSHGGRYCNRRHSHYP